jgi:transcriptional regulator with XRE-family HTH domain
MPLDMSSFGNAVASGRKEKELSQKELAAKITKEDGKPITPQYLNDIEHDRRQPSSDHLVRQFAKVLGIDDKILYGLVGMLPEQDRKNVRKATPEQVSQAFFAFRRSLGEKPKDK